MGRPRLRTPEVREAVLDAARGLLEAEGAAACTTRRIARLAGTSPPAIYEFFGDKEGLLRAVFFDGFHQLGDAFARMPIHDDPVEHLVATMKEFRAFARHRPALTELMFSRPFAAFDPNRRELAAGAGVRTAFVGRVQRGLDAGVLQGDAVDIAHALLALAMGFATQERGGWLGSSEDSASRRWEQGTRALLAGCHTGRHDHIPIRPSD